MSPPGVPSQDFAAYAALANRIAQHLHANPNDHQARDDLRYLHDTYLSGPEGAGESANAEDWIEAGGKPSAHPGYDALAGVADAALDIPKGIYQAVRHPVQVAGQVTGIGNIGHFLDTLHDPDAETAEKWDAFVRATPLNTGYAAERALLDATGAKSDAPDSIEEQVHRGGNVASLALLGAGAPARGPGTLAALRAGDVGEALKLAPQIPGAPSLLRGAASRVVGRIPYVGPLFRAVGEKLANIQDRYPGGRSPQEAIQREMEAGKPPEVPPHPESVEAVRAHEAGEISGTEMSRRLGAALGQMPEAPSDVLPRVSGPQAIPGSPKGISVVGPPTPPVPTTPTIAEMQSGRGVGGHSYTGTYPQGSGVADLPGRPGFTPAGGPSLAPGQLKALLDASPAEFDAAAGMLSPDIAAQIQALRAGGATGAHVEAAVGRMGAPSFSGGGFQGISEAMNTPAYQQAGTLAARILKDPKLLVQYPQFAGQNPEAATATLQRMLVEHARSGGTVPAITSLSRFLGRLAS